MRDVPQAGTGCEGLAFKAALRAGLHLVSEPLGSDRRRWFAYAAPDEPGETAAARWAGLKAQADKRLWGQRQANKRHTHGQGGRLAMTSEWARHQRFLADEADRVRKEADAAEAERKAKREAEKENRMNALLQEATQQRWEAERLARRAAYLAAGSGASDFQRNNAGNTGTGLDCEATVRYKSCSTQPTPEPADPAPGLG